MSTRNWDAEQQAHAVPGRHAADRQLASRKAATVFN